MKELARTIIGGTFSIALIVFFGMGKIPLEVFGPIATAVILWLFREREIANITKKLLGK